MSSKYINNSTYATSGYTLSGVFQSITIGPEGTVGGPGLIGGTKEAYTIVNRGRVTNLSGEALELKEGGAVSNGVSGIIVGAIDGLVVDTVAAAVTNSGVIEATGSSGVGISLTAGGIVSNGAGGVIEGWHGVAIDHTADTVSNSGTIVGVEAGRSNYATGIDMRGAGVIANLGSSALIEGYFAVDFKLGAGTVNNSGTIDATVTPYGERAGVAIELQSGGTVTNDAGGIILGGYFGVLADDGAATIINSGTIRFGGPDLSSCGIALLTGGRITNNEGAVVIAETGISETTATISNSGTIVGQLGFGGISNGVELDGGALYNIGSSAIIQGYSAVLGENALIINSGTIRSIMGDYGKIGTAISLSDGTEITNQEHGLIDGRIGIIVPISESVVGPTIIRNYGTIESTLGEKGYAIDAATVTTFVDEAGSVLVGQVAGVTNFELAGTGGVFGRTKFFNVGLLDLLHGASWEFVDNVEVNANTKFQDAGTLTETGLLTLVGVTTISGSIMGGGTLVLAGLESLGVEANLAVAHLEIIGGAVTLDRSLTYAGSFDESGGTLALASGDTLALSGAVDLTGGEIRSGKLLILGEDVSVGGLTVDAGGVLRDFGTITQMGKLKLGTASAPGGRLSIKTGAVFDIAADVKIGSGDAAGAIGIQGLLEKTAGTGTSTIVPNILNDGSIKVASGTLILAGAVTGSGIEKIKATATLDLAGAVAATQTIKFGPVTGGDLVLDDPAGSGLGFAGSIAGFGGSDRLDLASFAFSGKPKLAWSQDGGTGTLTVTDGADLAKITLFGQYATAGFKTAKDGGTGTVISYTASPAGAPALANPHR